MPYVGFNIDESTDQEARTGEATLLIERHVEEGVLKPSIQTRNYNEQSTCIRCIKTCGKFGKYSINKICKILSRSYNREEGRRLESLDGIRGIVYLFAFSVQVDQAALLIYPDKHYGESEFRLNYYGIWKTLFRISIKGSKHYLSVFLILSGFLSTFSLFLRSGPLLQKENQLSGKERIKSFINLSINFLGGRFLRVWPLLQVLTNYIHTHLFL